jgi:hypothetical protein
MTEGDGEVWRPVIGCAGVYEVPSQGRMRSLQRTAALPFGEGTRTVPERILTVNIVDERASMRFHRDGGSVARLLSGIILKVFIGPCPTWQLIHYRDGDRRNCALVNLSHVTPTWQRELKKSTDFVPMRVPSTAKLTSLQARAVDGGTEQTVDLAERDGIAQQTVCAIWRGRLWKAVTRDVRWQDRRVTARQSRTR